MQTHDSVISVSSDKACSPLPGMGYGRGTPSQRKIYAPLLGRLGEGRELLMCLPFSSMPSAQNNLYTKLVYFGGGEFLSPSKVIQKYNL